MTYCLAMRLEEGLLFLADTRTNAGLDNVSTFRKLHVLSPGPDRVFVLESAGNLATTQEVLDRLDRDLNSSGESLTLATADHLFEVALYIGRVSRDVVKEHQDALGSVGADATCSFILGGQIGQQEADILQIYPEGNYIRASDDVPFLQIGESKYGKFLLELGVEAHVGMQQAVKVALTSMMSTARANLSVGPPYDLALYRGGTFAVDEFRIDGDAEFLQAALESWERHLLAAITELPPLDFDAI
jgi:putative proteasome-type protease